MPRSSRKRAALSQDTASSSSRPRLDPQPPASSPSTAHPPLLYVGRAVWTLVLQLLPWREKALEASHLCHSLSPLVPLDFAFDHLLVFGKRRPSQTMETQDRWFPHDSTTTADFISSPRAGQLFSLIQRFSGLDKYKHAGTERLKRTRNSVLSILRPFELAVSPFARLRFLQLHVVHCTMASVLAHLFPSPEAFPCLAHLDITVDVADDGADDFDEVYGELHELLDPSDFAPLARPPRLTSLTLCDVMTLEGFSFLCQLPLIRLYLPMMRNHARDAWDYEEALLADALVCSDRHGSAVATASATHQPALQRLRGGWSTQTCIMEVIARQTSLVELEDGFNDIMYQDFPITYDLSPLFTRDLQPRLPLLRTFTFPEISLPLRSEATVAIYHASSAAFVIAYSAQLHHLHVHIEDFSGGASSTIVSVLQCAQLRRLRISRMVYGRVPTVGVDVAHFEGAFTALPPLVHLVDLQLNRVLFTEQALQQLLAKFPAVRQRLGDFDDYIREPLQPARAEEDGGGR